MENVIELNPTVQTAEELALIEKLEQECLEARKKARELNEKRIAALRPATETELKAVQAAVRNETEYPQGYNVTFKLTEEQRTTLDAFRTARKEELQDKKVRSKYMRMAGKMTLVSARYRETAKKDGGKPSRSLTMRFAK